MAVAERPGGISLTFGVGMVLIFCLNCQNGGTFLCFFGKTKEGLKRKGRHVELHTPLSLLFCLLAFRDAGTTASPIHDDERFKRRLRETFTTTQGTTVIDRETF